MSSKENATIIHLESGYNDLGAKMVGLPLIIKRSIKDFENFKRAEIQDDTFDAYEYIADCMPCSTNLIWTWVNKHTPVYPKLDQLTNLCYIIQDNTPLVFLSQLWAPKGKKLTKSELMTDIFKLLTTLKEISSKLFRHFLSLQESEE